MFVKILPLNRNVFILEDKFEDRETASGLIINANSGELVAGRGRIYEIAPETVKFVEKEQGVTLKKGMRIFYSLYSAEEVIMEDSNGMKIKGLKKLHISSIAAVIEEDEQ